MQKGAGTLKVRGPLQPSCLRSAGAPCKKLRCQIVLACRWNSQICHAPVGVVISHVRSLPARMVLGLKTEPCTARQVQNRRKVLKDMRWPAAQAMGVKVARPCQAGFSCSPAAQACVCVCVCVCEKRTAASLALMASSTSSRPAASSDSGMLSATCQYPCKATSRSRRLAGGTAKVWYVCVAVENLNGRASRLILKACGSPKSR